MNRSHVLSVCLCGLLLSGVSQAAWYSPMAKFGQTCKRFITEPKKVFAACFLATVAAGYAYTFFWIAREKMIDRRINAVMPSLIDKVNATRRQQGNMLGTTQEQIANMPVPTVLQGRIMTFKNEGDDHDALHISEPIVAQGTTWGKSWEVQLDDIMNVDGVRRTAYFPFSRWTISCNRLGRGPLCAEFRGMDNRACYVDLATKKILYQN